MAVNTAAVRTNISNLLPVNYTDQGSVPDDRGQILKAFTES
jgi:hypothetical protein